MPALVATQVVCWLAFIRSSAPLNCIERLLVSVESPGVDKTNVDLFGCLPIEG